MKMKIADLIRKNKDLFGEVLSISYRNSPFYVFDLTSNNSELAFVDVSNPDVFSNYVAGKIVDSGSTFGIGRYNENRLIYNYSTVFSGSERRTVHLGVDMWVPPGTEVLAPMSSRVHSFKNNDGNGDYGPTIILEHEIGGRTFYTLYGHLSLNSLNNLRVGQEFDRGEVIGWVGDYPVNGNWPSHLHFQIITDMQDREGDFPGVCKVSDRFRFAAICPDPNIILQING